ncbi:hypothetical protein LTR66_004529 [Elasticomyces elasticus]|nr:hypothetical protein LTR66_004529 [Elasticomyces elasticus]
MIESVGELPEKWQEKWSSMRTQEPMEPTGYDLQQWLEETYFDDQKAARLTRDEMKHIGTSIRRLLHLDPSARCTAKGVLQDKWLQDV